MTRPHVVYVSGAPRSGTTLISMALGQLPDACEIGELWALWGPAYRQNDACGCGMPVRKCPFWGAVIAGVFGPDPAAAGAAMGTLHERHLGTLRAPKVWAHASGRAPRAYYDEYAQLLDSHYQAIAQVSGAHLVIDSSKMTSDALLASTLGSIDLSVLHVVRDPRGVAWSWQKEVRQSGPNGRMFAQHGPLASAARWDAHNLFANALLKPRMGLRYRQLRYEDFVQNPNTTLRSIAAWLGVESGDHLLMGMPTALSLTQPRHPVWGNPLRSSTGMVRISPDEEWLDRLAPRDRAVTVAATLPFFARYGYGRRSSSAMPAAHTQGSAHAHH